MLRIREISNTPALFKNYLTGRFLAQEISSLKGGAEEEYFGPTETDWIKEGETGYDYLALNEEFEEFYKKYGLEKPLQAYINIASCTFKGASIFLSLAPDPEIENYTKILLDIKIKTDIDSLIQMDKEFYKSIDALVTDHEKNFFVVTYEVIE